MTVKSSLLKIKKCLTDEEILGLHFEGCPHAYANSEEKYELLVGIVNTQTTIVTNAG